MKFLKAMIACVVFVALLLLTYYIHIRYFKIDVVFYAAIADGVVAAMLTGIMVFVFRFFVQLNSFEKTQLLVIWLLSGYAFAISIPTVIDRSLSFYILEKLQQRGGGIQLNSFEEVFTKEYVKEHRLVDVRITEQIQSGTIEVVNGCVKLTNKGKEIAEFSMWFRNNFLPRQRLLMGEYSGDLTNPFLHSVDHENYVCK